MSAAEIVEGILAHHGVKGQKWGVRRARAKSSSVTVTDKKKKIKTTGGVGRPAHSDAVRARTIGQVGKKSGLKALSNEELRAYNERLNLEQNAKRLRHQDSHAAKRFIRTIAGKKGPGAVESGVKNLKSPKGKMLMAKGASAIAIAL